ncbi:hypothetical protein [Roseiterribacter gracilis]|uniref:Uncharacterized protein n=1 Tax=Roseiterribacter gracilis TaxID=2812848 RepID=A0A8S8XB94_9PROT|nr:hypothetical protein TMPK1_08120 [Rhodospirillales bacterium TMPK1]
MATYLDQKVREALDIAQGDQNQAQRVLVGWAQRDEKLLRELTQPFLVGIAAHAINHGGKIVPGLKPGKAPPPPKAMPPKALDSLIGQLGRNFEKSKGPLGVSGDAAPPPKKASPKHADTMRALANAFGKTKKR